MSLQTRLLELITAIGADIKALFGRSVPAGGAQGQVLAKSGETDYMTFWQDSAMPGPLPSLEAALAADVTLSTSGTWYDGPALALTAGKWLVMAHATCGRTATTLLRYAMRLTDGTTHYASSEAAQPSQNPNYVNMSVASIVTLTGAATVKIQCTTTNGGASNFMKAAIAASASGNNATKIVAVKIG